MGFVTTADEIMAFLASKGFHMETGRGKHGTKMIKDRLRISIPTHPGDMPIGTARKILARAGYILDDMMNWR